jgi:hypothetical protein
MRRHFFTIESPSRKVSGEILTEEEKQTIIESCKSNHNGYIHNKKVEVLLVQGYIVTEMPPFYSGWISANAGQPSLPYFVID